MAKALDLKGKRFGKLIVIERSNVKVRGCYKWLCICDCGNECLVLGSYLKNGHTSSCGCLQKEKTHERLVDLKGKTFGRLTVIGIHSHKDGNYYWNCKCSCGNETIVQGSSLKSNKTQSCGCMQKEIASKSIGDFNSKSWADEEYRNKMRGETHPHYKQELTEEDRQDRRCQDGYDDWCLSVKKMANFSCDCCNSHGVYLHSHHLDGYNWCKEKRLDVNNGVCLCESCHTKFHKKYGYGNNTKEQYFKFKEEESYEI